MQKVNSGTAYIIWGLCFFGICGGQRLYTGNVFSGLIYLFTFGVFGIGQFLDLILIPGMVNKRNIYLRGLIAGDGSGSDPAITLNIGNLKEIQQYHPSQPSLSKSPMQKLLKAANDNGGSLSMAQAVLYTELELTEVQELLREAQRHHLAEITNDPETGAIRYQFDL